MKLTVTWIYIIFITIIILIFSGLIYTSIWQVLQQPWSEEAVVGKKVWQQKGCVECHALLGNGGYNAVDLTKITLKINQEEFEKLLTKPLIIRPAKRVYHPVLNQKEAIKIYNYLEEVSTINTLNWPPKPFVPVHLERNDSP